MYYKTFLNSRLMLILFNTCITKNITSISNISVVRCLSKRTFFFIVYRFSLRHEARGYPDLLPCQTYRATYRVPKAILEPFFPLSPDFPLFTRLYGHSFLHPSMSPLYTTHFTISIKVREKLCDCNNIARDCERKHRFPKSEVGDLRARIL